MHDHDEHRYALYNNELVDAANLKQNTADVIRKASRKGEVTCPVCKDRVVPKLGPIKQWHFAHHADNEYKYHEPESPNHLLAKKLVAEQIQNIHPNYEVALEVKIPETRQIADVLAVTPEGEKIAIEIQYSDLSGADWRTRHELYAQAGVKDIWLLGHSRLASPVRAGTRLFKPDQLVVALLADKEAVIYVNPRRQELVFLAFPPRSILTAEHAQQLPKTRVMVHKFALEDMYFSAEQELRIKAAEPNEP